jgi:formylglycine-generating enzyme required for sulfatase activity
MTMKTIRFIWLFCLFPALCFAQNAVPVNMVLLDRGSFFMGSDTGEISEKPVHTVTIRSFFMGKYDVTQGEWTAVMGDNPSNFKGDTLPVENVSWYDAVAYCNALSIKEGLTPAYKGRENSIVCNFKANGYRLPTEAEWEYAAKGGNKDYRAYEYSGMNNVNAVGWHRGNSVSRTHPVGTKEPNSVGIYDMSGNVWEWCWDRYGSYGGKNQANPKGSAGRISPDVLRVRRGGSWSVDAASLRTAARDSFTPASKGNHLGFRVCRSL